MTYKQSVEYIHSLLKFGIHPGLSRMNTLLSYIGNPEKDIKFVHIAGTNGKGSTATAIANILIDAGYKTGLFTSPYVTHFLERVQINSQMISENVFAKVVSDIAVFVDEMREKGEVVTEFELITAAAFLCYKREKCDIVILETGLGGRLDATNVITKPLLEIITSISLDHTSILGNTIEKIAYEKCGIIKENTEVVCSFGQETAALSVVKEISKKRNCKLYVPYANDIEVLYSDIFKTDFMYKGFSYEIMMSGTHQIQNMTASIEAAEILKSKGFSISQKNIYNGILKTKLPARIEIINKEPLIILDGGHNPSGVEALIKLIKQTLPNRNITAVIGMMEDKDVNSAVKLFAEAAKSIICVTVENNRAIKAEKLLIIAKEYCESVLAFNSIKDVYPKILSTLNKDDVLLIAGSLYLAGEVKHINIK